MISWVWTGWIPSGWWAMQGDFKSLSLYIKQRFAKGVQRNIPDFLKAWITTDSIKIFSIKFCTLVTVYCTCKIAKDAFRIELYVTTSCLRAALRCSSFRFETVTFLRLYIRGWYVYCCMLLKDSVFVLWIHWLKCSLKTSVSLVLATDHLKLQVKS